MKNRTGVQRNQSRAQDKGSDGSTGNWNKISKELPAFQSCDTFNQTAIRSFQDEWILGPGETIISDTFNEAVLGHLEYGDI